MEFVFVEDPEFEEDAELEEVEAAMLFPSEGVAEVAGAPPTEEAAVAEAEVADAFCVAAWVAEFWLRSCDASCWN